MPDLNTDITYFKIDYNYNDNLDGYILDASNNHLNNHYINQILDFVIANHQLHNIKHVNISYNDFEFQSEIGHVILNKILYCYLQLHIGINASHGLNLPEHEQYNISEAERNLWKAYNIYIN